MKNLFFVLILPLSLTVHAEGPATEKVSDKPGHKMTEKVPEQAQKPPGIDREAIRAVIRNNIKLFESCYKKSLQENPKAHGKVELRWTVTEGGKAQNVKVAKSSISDESLHNCMMGELAKLKFPEPPAGQVAEVSYPFVFAGN